MAESAIQRFKENLIQMRNIVSMSVVAIVLVMGSMTAFAQAGASAPKIGIVDVAQFRDEKAGITKLLNANRALSLEFQPAENDLNLLTTRLQNLQKEVQTLREAQEKGNPPVDPKTVKAKEDEFNKLYAEYQQKGEALQQRSQQREDQVVGPILQEIFVALGDYAKQKGFSLMLRRDSLLVVGDEKLDVTKDFITFFNSKPAAPAAPPTQR